jgi:hypothetical protein
MTWCSEKWIDDRDRCAHVAVIPAKAGQIRLERIWSTGGWPEGQSPWMDFAIQFARHSRESGNPVPFSQDFFGSARCRERATFVSAKVAKTIAPA